MNRIRLWMAVGGIALVVAMGLYAQAQDAKKKHFTMMANGYYAREDKDREWHVRLVGEIKSLCGAYIVVHNAQGKAVYHGMIPCGKYPEDKPFVVTVKPDGVTGDYKIVLCGYQDDKLGFAVPFTDLPFEVYGGSNFSMGHDPDAKPYFRVPEGITKIKVGAYKAHMSILGKDGKVIADTRVSKLTEKYDNVVEFNSTPGEMCQVIRDAMYFRCSTPGAMFLCFDPARWFRPSPALDEVKWWECVPTGVGDARKPVVEKK